MGYVIAGALGVGMLAVILWAGRNDDSSESTFHNMWRGVYVIGGIAAVFGAIIWVGTYGT